MGFFRRAALIPAVAVEQQKTQPKRETQEITAFITRTGKKYHLSGCRSLSKSRISISLTDAKKRGYTVCRVCKPPQ